MVTKLPTSTSSWVMAALPHLTTDCVLVSDMALARIDLEFAYAVWRGHFFNHLVGFSFTAANHVDQSSRILYAPVSPKGPPFYSLVLPRAMMIHAKYFQSLASLPDTIIETAVRNGVDCEALLLNIVVASDMNTGPVVLNTRVAMPSTTNTSSDDTIAMGKCLHELQTSIGRIQLYYTRNVFVDDGASVPPALERLRSEATPPRPFHCTHTDSADVNVCMV
jgi:hypothetical protein